jgi:hypothetical protein
MEKMTWEDIETRIRKGDVPEHWCFKEIKDTHNFIDHRTKTVELTDLECDIAKSAAIRMTEDKGRYYGDFAVGNFVTGIKGEMAVAKYLHGIKPFKDLSRAVNFSRKDYGDGGIDIHWGRWRIQVKTTGTRYGELILDTHRPSYGPNLYILAHLKFDGMNRKKGNTLYAHKNRVDIYGFLTPEEYFGTDENNKLLLAEYYDDPQLPTKYKVRCWYMRPIRDLQPTTTA